MKKFESGSPSRLSWLEKFSRDHEIVWILIKLTMTGVITSGLLWGGSELIKYQEAEKKAKIKAIADMPTKDIRHRIEVLIEDDIEYREREEISLLQRQLLERGEKLEHKRVYSSHGRITGR